MANCCFSQYLLLLIFYSLILNNPEENEISSIDDILDGPLREIKIQCQILKDPEGSPGIHKWIISSNVALSVIKHNRC